MAKDSVCETPVDEKGPPASHQYKGKTYYFCAVGCKEKFAVNPEKFLKKAKEQNVPEEQFETN